MRKLRLLIAAALLALAATATQPAAAIGLNDARAQGLVGETQSGYIAPVKRPNAEVQQLINTVNGKRREHYKSIAARNGVSVEEVGRLSARKLISGLPGGVYYQSASGGWERK